GHGIEEIADKTAQQMKKVAFTHLSRFTTDSIEKCAKTISELTPGDLNHVYFVSGGSEATETSMKLARQYFTERDKNTSKWKIISRWKSFHGNTLGALSATGMTERRSVYDPMLINFPKINQAYCYRCPYKKSVDNCKYECAYELENKITQLGANNIAAFIAEPVIGSAIPGANPPKDYFKIIRDICNKYDILLIIDEVMAGFGRTGKNFGIDHYGIVPDIMAVAKGMSCGYSPLGAAITNDKVFNTIMVEGSGQFIHGHTYGGNPLSAEIANVVFEICKRENYYKNSEKQGTYLLDKLEHLYKYPIIGDVRGKGLMIGIEFVKNQQTKEPFNSSEKIKQKITVNCLENGLVVYPGGGSVDGIRGDHILIAPPLPITKEEVDILYDKLEKSVQKTSETVSNLVCLKT
ncbi:MAG: aspartate aminotransferase family protein, partial [Promethearchaeota archaeon]